jgi:hypothetical protein
VRTRERGEDPSTSRFTFTINLFITILIGLKLSTFLFYVWTEDIFFRFFYRYFVNTERHLKVVSYQDVYEMISLPIRLLMPDNHRDYNVLTTVLILLRCRIDQALS